MIIPRDNGYFKNFQGHDRFDVPEPVYRVTGGFGGEAYLIIGSEKTALHDCGMACYSRELISNIHEMLDPLGRTLDMILMSHTHYDHIGALPYILDEWPEAQVMGALKAVQVFGSDAAKETMRELGDNATNLYGADFPPVKTDGLRIDRVLEDGEEVSLGDISLRFYEAKGHTDCSAAYILYPQNIMFACESVGQVEGPDDMRTSCLKSFRQCIESSYKLRKLEPDRIIAMHYGILPKEANSWFFDKFVEEAEWELGLIERGIKNGLSDEEVSKAHDMIYWNESRRLNHPYDANHLNTMIIIRRVRKEMEAEYGKL